LGFPPFSFFSFSPTSPCGRATSLFAQTVSGVFTFCHFLPPSFFLDIKPEAFERPGRVSSLFPQAFFFPQIFFPFAARFFFCLFFFFFSPLPPSPPAFYRRQHFFMKPSFSPFRPPALCQLFFCRRSQSPTGNPLFSFFAAHHSRPVRPLEAQCTGCASSFPRSPPPPPHPPFSCVKNLFFFFTPPRRCRA